LALPCTDALDSVYQGQTPPADWGPEMRGDITQCTFERTISIEEMAEAFTVSDSFVTPALSTPVYKYRIQYWTERNEGEPVLTSAALVEPTLMSVAMQFFVGHLAAYEGEDSRLDAFLPEKREEARQMPEEGCWSQITSTEEGPPSIGVTVGSDLFVPAYVEEVGNCGLTDTCETELAQTWRARWVVDRPAPNTTIPIFHWTGGMDTFISPGFQKCGLDRLEAQGGDVTACVEADGDHSGIVTKNADWVRQHLDQVFLGGDARPGSLDAQVCEALRDASQDFSEFGVRGFEVLDEPGDTFAQETSLAGHVLRVVLAQGFLDFPDGLQQGLSVLRLDFGTGLELPMKCDQGAVQLLAWHVDDTARFRRGGEEAFCTQATM
jgi:hypothetical protein